MDTQTANTERQTDVQGNPVYRIPEQNVDALKAKVEKLNRRALKLQLDPIVVTAVGDRVEEYYVRSESTLPAVKHYRRYVLVTVTGKAPKVAGWTFAATLQHGEDGQNILRTVPGTEEPVPARFRTVTPACGHCGVNRLRKDTYLLVSEADGWQQVGRNCLADFLRTEDVSGLASWAEILAGLGELAGSFEEEDSEYGFGRTDTLIALDAYLGQAAACIRLDGWVSRAEAKDSYDGKLATSDSASYYLSPGKMADLQDAQRRDIEAHAPTAADHARAAAAIAWAQELPQDVGNDYLWNLRVLAERGILDRRGRGLAASLIAAHDKHVARETERAQTAERLNEHFGVAGVRSHWTLKLVKTQSMETQWGATTLMIFEDSERRTAKWFASGSPEYRQNEPYTIGESYVVDATVKAHEVYQGLKQTVLTRVSWHLEKPAKKARAKKAEVAA